LVKLLAECGANVETPTREGSTPLMLAASNGCSEVVRLLAELGANVETPDNNGVAPVCTAAKFGHAEVVRLLAELGANVETPTPTLAPGSGNITPVCLAAMMGHANVVRVLAELGADLNTQGSLPWSNRGRPLFQARAKNRVEAAQTLLLLGATTPPPFSGRVTRSVLNCGRGRRV